MNVRIGIIGIGAHAREVIVPSLVALDQSDEVTAVCDSRAEARAWASSRFAKAYVAESIEDEEFWSRIDCVIACATPQVHEVVLAQAVKRRIHCLCEKPVGSSAATLTRLADLYDGIAAPRPVIRVGHNFRYTAGGSRFIDLLGSGLRKMSILNLFYSGAGPRGSRWGLRPREAFALTHLTHAVDFVMASAGTIDVTGNVDWAEDDGIESVSFTLRTRRCALVCVSATNAAAAFTCTAKAVFEDGTAVELDSLRSVTVTGTVGQDKRAGPMWRERDLGTLYQNDGYGEELRAFLAEVRGAGASRLPDLRTAAAALDIVGDVVLGGSGWHEIGRRAV